MSPNNEVKRGEGDSLPLPSGLPGEGARVAPPTDPRLLDAFRATGGLYELFEPLKGEDAEELLPPPFPQGAVVMVPEGLLAQGFPCPVCLDVPEHAPFPHIQCDSPHERVECPSCGTGYMGAGSAGAPATTPDLVLAVR